MRRPPAVSYSVKRSHWHERFIALLFIFACGLLVAFAFAQAVIDVRSVVMASALLGIGAFAFHAWQKSPHGTLHWDGQHWFWSGFDAHRPCRLAVVLDFQRLVVVSIVGEDKAATWLWLEADRGNPDWMPLRRAIFARQKDAPGEGNLVDSVDQAHPL